MVNTNDVKKAVPYVIGAFALLWLYDNWASASVGLSQVGGDAGYNRGELVNPRVAYRDIERPDYTYPAPPRRSIVQ